MNPFHLAFPVHDIQAARRFYGEILGCAEGRSSDTWIDFNLYGHQIVAHYQPLESLPKDCPTQGSVDGGGVPVPHFGVVLTLEDWQVLRDRLKQVGIPFKIEPHIRFKDQPGEQATMFFLDPFGNALEFKAFRNPSQLFAR